MDYERTGLAYFFLGWMHPNWSDIYNSLEDAMRDFVCSVNEFDELIQCRLDLDKWLEEYTTDESAEGALKESKVGYWFSDETMHGLEFLHRLRDAFDEAIKERKDVM